VIWGSTRRRPTWLVPRRGFDWGNLSPFCQCSDNCCL